MQERLQKLQYRTKITIQSKVRVLHCKKILRVAEIITCNISLTSAEVAGDNKWLADAPNINT